MKVKEKNNLLIVAVAALLTLLLGFGIQFGLHLRDVHREQQRGIALMDRLQTSAEAAGEAEHGTISALTAGRERAHERKMAHLMELERLDMLILVNPWNPIPEGYTPVLRMVDESHAMDERCADALLQMINDCREAGMHPYICSAYRTQEYQQGLFDNKVLRVILSGVDAEEAPAVAARSVAVPGTSEHQLGLAVDIIDEFYTNLDQGQEGTDTQQWLMENCWRYGFILRYPNGTTEKTGIIYEPWHYRYVGEFAEEIHKSGLVFEDYIAQRRGR